MNHLSSRLFVLLLLIALVTSFLPQTARAGDCYSDPVTEYDWTGTTNIGSFVRDEACMQGSTVLATIPQGTPVRIIGETDGWYRVQWNDTRGWVGATLLSVTAKRFKGKTWDSYTDYMRNFPSSVGYAAGESTEGTSGDVTPQPLSSSARTALLNRTRGYILLQVENHGEAWYVDPVSDRRYYMKDGPTAYQMMRSFGLGVSETDYAAMAAGNTSLKARLRGRIILRVQEHGEAYYIHPQTLALHYLQNGDEAYRVMRLYSLGITNTDLTGITSDEVPIK